MAYIAENETPIPLRQINAQCTICDWVGTADELGRVPLSEIEIGGTETDARVVDQRQGVIVSCPQCHAPLGQGIVLSLPQDLPSGTYCIDMMEGL